MSFSGKSSLTIQTVIHNDGFWPDVSVGDLINQYRIPAEYADDVIKTGLVTAMIRTNDLLADVKKYIEGFGFNSLGSYAVAHTNQFNQRELTLINYEIAVFCRAKAFLLQQFNSLNRKPEAENAAKESDKTEDYWLDESQKSVFALAKLVIGDAVNDTQISATATAYVAMI